MELEFFHDKTGAIKDEIYDIAAREPRKLEEFTELEISALFDHLLKFPEAHKALLQLNRYFPTQKRKILSIFIDCNWAIINNIPDITDKKLNYECISCKHKPSGKTCPYKGLGIVCIIPERDLFST